MLDGETNTPLPGATVFIANTTYGLATGTEGEFMIKGLPAAHYKLVISFIGYQTYTLDVLAGKPVTYKIILKPSAKKLPQVIIHSKKRRSNSEWPANFEIFKERFIGLSENAKYCSFYNQYVLSFDHHEGILDAYADSTLVIDNRGLGYRINVILDEYRYNLLTHILHYEGQMSFEKLTPANEEEKLKWAKNRLKAYYGSEMHFLRSLYNRDLNKNGFYFVLSANKNTLDYGIKRKGEADTVMAVRSKIYEKKIRVPTILNYNRILDSAMSTPQAPVLSYKGDLELQYVDESESHAYQAKRTIFPGKNPQRSTLLLLKKCIVQPHGDVYPLDAVETKNYWSWELVAESLPLDYDPGADLLIVQPIPPKP